MGGQCPGAPELKGPRERQETKKKMIEKKQEKEEKKRENETFQIPGRGPNLIYPHESK